jgi:hypothetical protein
MPVASVYPAYIANAEKKARTRAEVDEIFRWLTGHSQASLEAEFAKKTSFEDFFALTLRPPGHVLHEEDPTLTVAAVKQFLEKEQ